MSFLYSFKIKLYNFYDKKINYLLLRVFEKCEKRRLFNDKLTKVE